jgi:hypothetical protein
MIPVTGIVEKKATDSLWEFVHKLFIRRADLKRENLLLKLQLDEKLAFERKLTELDCHPEDDSIYWKKDGSGAGFCPLCISGPEKLFTPLTHGASKGSFYCRLHDHVFETEVLRERRSNRHPARRASRFSGPNAWMGK